MIQRILLVVLFCLDQSTGVQFIMQDLPGKGGNMFVIELTDPIKIQHARDLVSGKSKSLTHISGEVKKKQSAYNKKWSFYLDSKSITFFDVAVEVCDATITYVEDHLDEACGAFLPGCLWCPWSSTLIRELKPVNKTRAAEY